MKRKLSDTQAQAMRSKDELEATVGVATAKLETTRIDLVRGYARPIKPQVASTHAFLGTCFFFYFRREINRKLVRDLVMRRKSRSLGYLIDFTIYARYKAQYSGTYQTLKFL